MWFAVTLLISAVERVSSWSITENSWRSSLSGDSNGALSCRRFAVVIAGTSGDAQHYNWFWGATNGMYDILKDRYGYGDADIYFLFEDDHGGDPRVDYTATKTNLETVFDTLVSTMNPVDTLFCYFVGHGSASGGYSYYDTVGADLKDTELNTMRQGIQSGTQTFVFSPCHSGHFCDELGRLGTITITSCRIDEVNRAGFAEAIRDALGYREDADSDGNGQVSFGEAYNYALNKVVEWYQNHGIPLDEHCQIDDDGDGVSTYGTLPTDGHGLVSLNRFLDPPPLPPVGGIMVPVDKLSLLYSYIGAASTIVVATVATAIYAKCVKRRKKKL